MILSRYSARWTNILNILGGALILTYPALRNRFPLVNSDSGTYLLTAITDLIPFDRPVFYGYFIGWTNIYESLWIVVYVQNILLAVLIWKTMKKLSPGFSAIGYFLVIILLTSLTAIAWFSCQIMTDVFTPLLLLSLSLLLLDRRMGIAEMIFLFLVFFFSCLVHYSHFLLAAAIVVSVAMLKLVKRSYFEEISVKRVILAGCAVALAILFIPIHNYFREGEFYLSKGNSILFTSKLVENGLLKKYLDAHCHDDPSPLCAHKDNLPEWGPPFLYGDQSAINIIGADKANAECGRLNRRIAESYPLPLALLSIKGGAINLFRLEAGTGIHPYDDHSAPYQPLKDADRTEFHQWTTSMQQGNQLHFELLTVLQRFFIYTSLLILLFNFYSKPLIIEWSSSLVSFTQVILLALVLNAFITGAMASEHDDRYQSRIAWLIPLIILMQYQRPILQFFYAHFQRWNKAAP
jgi:hypothetical protein